MGQSLRADLVCWRPEEGLASSLWPVLMWREVLFIVSSIYLSEYLPGKRYSIVLSQELLFWADSLWTQEVILGELGEEWLGGHQTLPAAILHHGLLGVVPHPPVCDLYVCGNGPANAHGARRITWRSPSTLRSLLCVWFLLCWLWGAVPVILPRIFHNSRYHLFPSIVTLMGSWWLWVFIQHILRG